MAARLKYEVLEIVKDSGPATVREVHHILNQQRPISLNAVATVMNRLLDQGLLFRSGSIRHYQYDYRPSDAVLRERADHAVRALLSEIGDAGLVHFINAVDRVDPAAVDRLETLLANRRGDKSR